MVARSVAQPGATKLDPRQVRAVALLASGMSVFDVAEELDMDRTSVWRWKHDPDFAAALSAKVGEVSRDLTARVADRLPRAFAALDEALESTNEGTKLRAAMAIIDAHTRLLESRSGMSLVTPEVMEELRRAGREAEETAPRTPDVHPLPAIPSAGPFG